MTEISSVDKLKLQISSINKAELSDSEKTSIYIIEAVTDLMVIVDNLEERIINIEQKISSYGPM